MEVCEGRRRREAKSRNQEVVSISVEWWMTVRLEVVPKFKNDLTTCRVNTLSHDVKQVTVVVCLICSRQSSI